MTSVVTGVRITLASIWRMLTNNNLLAGYLTDLLTDFYSLYLCISIQCLLL